MHQTYIDIFSCQSLPICSSSSLG